MPASKLTRRSLLVAALGSAAWHAAAQGRPITIVVPQPAGNPSDAFMRKMQPILQRELGVPVLVENLPGAGGSLGVQKVLNAPADGQMLTMVSQTEPILTPLAMASARYQPEALRPVGTVGRTSYVLVGRPELPAATYAELVALARQAKDKPLTFGHIGPGGMIHLLGSQWSRLSALPLVHVPYKGVPPMLQDLLGGQIDLSFVPLGGSAISMLEGGRLRIYGSTAAQAPALLPKIVPLSTQDPALREFVHGAWGALMLPRGTPEPAVQRVHAAFNAAMRDAEVLAFLRSNGTEPQAPLSLEALDQFYANETRLHQKLARSVGIVPE